MRFLPVLLSLQLLACAPMAQKSTQRVSGLWLNPNDANAPEGALSVADNVVLTRPGVAEPRRGMTKQSTGTSPVNALTSFAGYLIKHYSTNLLARSSDSGATWTAYSGTYAPPDSSTPVRFMEQAGSLFFTTAAGVYQLDSATGTPRLTGVPRGLDGTATLNRTSSTAGWSAPNSQSAYRFVWGYKDANNKVQLGAPSGRVIVTNPATFSATTAQVTKANGTSTVSVSGPTHGLATGEYIDVTLGGVEARFTAGTFQVTVSSSTVFTYSDANTNSTGAPVSPGASMTFGMTRNVTLAVPIPSGVTTSYFLQVYRSAASVTASTEPSDALGLVYEAIPTNVDVSAGTISISDVTPDTLRGATLYTSVEGLLAAKDRPQLARDVALWRDTAFAANTTGGYQYALRFLSVTDWNASGGASTSSTTFNIYDNGSLSIQMIAGTAESSSSGLGVFKKYTTGTTAQNIADTTKSWVRMFNAAARATSVSFQAEYTSGDSDAPGSIRIYRPSPSDAAFTFYVANAAASNFSPAPVTAFGSAAGGAVRVGTTVTVTTLVPHGLVSGQQVSLLVGEANFAAGTKTLTGAATTTTFTYTEAGTAGASSGFLAYFTKIGMASIADGTAGARESYSNGLRWSALGEPWAWPAANVAFVGQQRATILRVVPTRDKLIVRTDAGDYQVTGSYGNFVISELDTTVALKAAGTAAPLGGRVYGLTNQGVTEALDSERVVSLQIDNALRDLQAGYSTYVSARAFAVPYESERMLLLFVPSGANAYSSNAYAFFSDSGQWTKAFASFNATCGHVSPIDDRLYLGDSSGAVWRENKARTTADQFDTGAASVTYDDVTGNVVSLSDTSSLSVGDGVTQAGATTITAITTNTSMTVADGTAFSPGGGTFSVSKAIPSVVEFAQAMPAGPGGEALVDVGAFDFSDTEWTTGSLYVATNLVPTLSSAVSLAPPGGSTSGATELAFPIPQGYQRGTRWRVRFAHGKYGERYALQGFTLNFRPTSGRAGR